ncbi:MAG TPA: hypothetical protein VFR86_09015, partial [Burkholderiaceae bacterium]|nr:hypothetical protein [Burkholderiaceae bacterium]
TEVRQAEAYVRREATHAAGDTGKALDKAGAELESAANAVEKEGIKAERRMHRAFERAKHALAMRSGSKKSPFDEGA